MVLKKFNLILNKSNIIYYKLKLFSTIKCKTSTNIMYFMAKFHLSNDEFINSSNITLLHATIHK